MIDPNNTATVEAKISKSLEKLTNQGLQHSHPTRFYHIKGLLNRAQKSEPALQSLLLNKAHEATAQLLEIKESRGLKTDKQPTTSPLSELTKALQKKSNKTVKRKQSENFDDLIQQQEVNIFKAENNKATETESQTVVEAYRDTIAQMNTKKFIQQVINEVPKDPGPLNAHKLVIKTLTAMQAISPSYLRRIVNQIDTMFYLHEAEPTANKKATSK